MAIVTVSREFGSRGREIGQDLARGLGYDYIDKERIFAEIQKRSKIWARLEQEMGGSCPTVWERFDRSFVGVVALVEEAILDSALCGKVVAVGRGGNWLFRDIPHALHVRVVAPLETRVKQIMEREGLGREGALSLIRKTDHDRSCYMRTVYHCDWADPAAYDVVFDTARLDSRQVIRMITDIMPGKDRLATESAKLLVRQRAAASKVKAELMTRSEVFVPTLEVFHDGRAIIIRGIVKSPQNHKLVEDIARAAAGEEPVQCDLHYRL